MFCLGLSYANGGAKLGHNKHVLSMKTKCQVPLFQSINLLSPATNIFIYNALSITYISLPLTVLGIIYSSLNIEKNRQFIFS